MATDDSAPSISVIIPVRPGLRAERTLQSLSALDYDHERVEVLVVEGERPSAQRNSAARVASGDILYFLDDDSEADIDLFRFAARTYRDSTVAIVGGPSVISDGSSLLQRCIGYLLSSFFATANVRCRYRAIGRTDQEGTEQKLILCNLSVRRDVFLQENGFDERLYPNEENEFLNRLIGKGYRAIYNPKVVVSRPHRKSFGQFVKQMVTYGRGRFEHLAIRPSSFNPLYLLPLAFSAYVVSLPVAVHLLGPTWGLIVFLIPLAVYVEGVAVTTLRILAEECDWAAGLLIPWLFPVVHFCYALGFACGLASRMIPHLGKIQTLKPVGRDSQVWVRQIKPLGTSAFAGKPCMPEPPTGDQSTVEDLIQTGVGR